MTQTQTVGSEPKQGRFSDSFYSAVAQNNSGNVFLSPYSVDVALGMTLAGARGDTRKALSDLLGTPVGETEANLHYKRLVEEVAGDGGERPFALSVANALWGQDGYPFAPEYAEIVRRNFGGEFASVNYRTAAAEAVGRINDWTDKATNGLIPVLVTEDAVTRDTRLILTNAIYFKGEWDTQFEKGATVEGNFRQDGGTVSKANLMRQFGESYLYADKGDYKVIDLPYRGDEFSMLVVLPQGETKLSDLESRGGLYDAAREGLTFRDVNLTLPKFKFETSYKLKAVLKDLGADIIFSDRLADFSGMLRPDTTERLKVDEVIHKAVIDVNEEGTEAAAATAVVMARCTSAMVGPRPVEFKADRTFAFYIRNRRTGTVLFQGRCDRP